MMKHTNFLALSLFCGIGFLFAITARAQTVTVPNASFENGAGNSPIDWSPAAGGKTQWENSGHTGNHSISVSATKAGESLYWKCDHFSLKPDQLYRFSFWSKDESTTDGCIISGFSNVNHDFTFGGSNWTFHSFVFVSPHQQQDNFLRLGQWNSTGKVYFDDVQLQEAVPLYSPSNGLELGAGESIRNNEYQFSTTLPTSNFSRDLKISQAAFNSNRWVFSGDSQVIYQHQLNNVTQQSAQIAVSIGYYQGGALLVEASRDGVNWVEVGRQDKASQLRADLPASLFPATSIQVRLRAVGAADRKGDSAPGSFQVNSYQYTAKLAGDVPDARGVTQFLSIEKSDPQINVKVLSLGNLLPGSQTAQLQIANAQNLPLQARLTLQQADAEPLIFESAINNSAVSIPYSFRKTGEWNAQLEVLQNKKVIYDASTDFSVASLYTADYGKRLEGMDDLWWCGSANKIVQERPMPSAADKSIFVPIQLARNEYEAVQIVARPQKDITNVTATAGDLTGPGGAKIGAANITIDQVAYVQVVHPTDATGAAGNWPDPLPPLNKPIALKANQNQPFWITIFAPKNIPAGTYTGKVLLSGDGWRREVPLHVTVWNFTLSDQTHIKSALGLSAGRIAPYHHVSGDALSKLMDKYYADFARHRISPYDPVYGAPITVDWGLDNVVNWQGGTLDASAPFAGKISLRVDDTNPHSSISAIWPTPLPVVNRQTYFLKFAVRTAQPDQQYQVTINTQDADGKWISGNNFDSTKTGGSVWQEVSIDVSQHLANPKVHSVTISLRPTRWTDDGAGTGTAWFDNVQLLKNNTDDLLQGKGSFEAAPAPVTAAQVKIDFSAFDKAMENAIAKYHITTFRLGIQGVGYRPEGPDSYAPGHVGNYIQGSPEYDTLFGSYVRQLQDHLQQKGWLDKAFLYWYDEPGPGAYKPIAEMGDIIHRYAPKLKWMLTEQPGPELEHSVDIFCPILNLYDHQTAADLQAHGKEIWWYICTGPKAPYVGEFIDRAAIEPRLWLWQTWKNKVQGILIWATVYWTSHAVYPNSLQNPWDDPESWSTSGSPWGNGDGRWLYPPQRDPNTDKTPNMDAPINSMRWELLRDGVEDYEYLWTLQQQVDQLQQKNLNAAAKTWLASAKVLLQVPDSISTDLTHFNKSPEAIMARRAAIAQAIVEGEQILQ